MKCTMALLCLAFLLAAALAPVPGSAQQPNSSYESGQITAGTRFLVQLQERLCTKDNKTGQSFTVRTLDALSANDGMVLRPGAEIRGHIDKVASAGKAGRARLWLAFDDIRTPAGWKPLVADVIDVPGLHSIHVAYDHENEIETSTSKRERDFEAAAAGALVGAAAGITARDKREAAIGAAVGAATAFMASSGLGQEITIEKDTKLELVLGHPLHLGGS
jgi:hypothetical protein